MKKIYSLYVCIALLTMAGSKFNCAEKASTRDCGECVKEDIQKMLNKGQCQQAKDKAGTTYPELKALANLCLGGPSLSCLTGAQSDSSSGSKNFLALAGTCATGGSSLLIEAIDSNKLDQYNEALALMYLLFEAIGTGSAGCTDGTAGGCSALGTSASFTDARLAKLNTYSKSGILPSAATSALMKCNNTYCSSVLELIVNF